MNTLEQNKNLKNILIYLFFAKFTVLIIGVMSRVIVGPYHNLKQYVTFSEFLPLEIWGVWDSGWYMKIVNDWYSADFNPYVQSNHAFFPLYPFLVRILKNPIIDEFVIGLLISNGALILTCIYLYKLISEIYYEEIATNSVKYLIAFPTSFILSGFFTESLYLCLVVMCFYYSMKNRWLTAAIIGLFLSFTRNVGVFIIIPLLFEYLKSIEFNVKNISYKVLYLLFIPLGFVLWGLYNYFLTGDFLAFVHVQLAWDRENGNPVNILFGALFNNSPYHLFLGWFSFISLLIIILNYKKIPVSFSIFSAYSFLLPLCSSVDSMPRYILVIFPIYIILACLSIRSRQLHDIILTVSLLLQGFLMVLWSNGFKLVM